MHIWISLCIKFHFEQTILNFWTKFAQERYLWSKTEKVNIIIEFRLFKLVLVPNFSLNWQFWFFWPDLPKKGFSGLKQKKWTPHIFYIILHIQISLVQNFSSNWQYLFFGSNLHKKVFLWSKTEKVIIIIEFRIFKLVSWYQIFKHIFYIVLYIKISLVTNFIWLKLLILIFWTKFAQKGISSRQEKKWTSPWNSKSLN